MKVLVTGATGLVGCHSVAALQAAGHEVRLLVRSPVRAVQALEPLGVRPGDYVVGDLLDRPAVEKALDGCDAVLHAAGLFSLDRERSDEILRTNIEGTEHVLSAAVRRGCDPIVHVSSLSALWPPSGDRFTTEDPVKEPAGPYARSKAGAERLARHFQKRGAPVSIVYPGTVWGPHDPTLGAGVDTVLQFLRAGFLPLTPGGIPIIDVRDLAAVHAALMEPGRGPRRFMAAGHLCTTRDLAGLLRELTGRRIFTVPVPGAVMLGLGHLGDVFAPLGRGVGITSEAMETLTRMVPADCSALGRELGVELRPLRDTLRETIRWLYAENHVDRKHAGAIAGETGTENRAG